MGYFSRIIENDNCDREDISNQNNFSLSSKQKQLVLLRNRKFLEEQKKYLARYGKNEKTYEYEREENSDLEYGSRR